ncbi:MAG: permease-like cell division protein FtsX [Bacilli bacterium]|nr:permease-like cell division protein FtsX [Bacilli bacterium]
MKAFRILGRNIRDSFKSVFRNFSLSLASISCITITLMVVAVSIVLSFNVTNFTKIVERDVTIVAFLDVDITEEEREKVYDQIIVLDNIEPSNVEFIDKMDISEEMMESSDVFNSIMSEWTREESPIQDTYQIKVTDINLINKTAEEIKDIKNVDIVKYGEGMVEQLVSVFDVIRKVTFGIVIALIIVTAFLIANTIKITIMSRKREIEIMRLVGASNINIKIPFIFEGLILGMFGSIIPIVVTLYGYTALYDHFGGQLFTNFIKLVEPTPFIYLTSLGLLLIGMIVGMFGSSRAVKKYLKI